MQEIKMKMDFSEAEASVENRKVIHDYPFVQMLSDTPARMRG